MPFYGPSGGGTAATQAEQETGSSTTVFVTPGRQQYHASAAKCWGKFTANSTTIEASYNITSVADTATGRMTVTIATDFSGADWAGFICVEWTTFVASPFAWQLDSAPAAGTCVLESYMYTEPTFAAADATAWMFLGLGDQ